MLSDYAYSPLRREGPSAVAPGIQPCPRPAAIHNYDSLKRTQIHLLSEGAMADIHTVNQQQPVRLKLTNQFTTLMILNCSTTLKTTKPAVSPQTQD